MPDFVAHPLVAPSWLAAHLVGYRDLAFYDASWKERGEE